MGVNTIVFMLAIVQCVLKANGQQEALFFRKDYTYIDSIKSFYKIHTLGTTWLEAKERCELEGAALYYPENHEEAEAVQAHQIQIQPKFSRIHIGISDLLAKGFFTTVDGRPIGDVYTNWGFSQPDNYQGKEDCVELLKDGKMYDAPCNNKNPFICKKALKDVQWNQECHMPRKDYIYNSNLNRCYKVHTDARNWTEAFKVCNAEMSYLAVINNEAEADFLVQLSSQFINRAHGSAKILEEQVLVGFYKDFEHEWKTVKGESLEESGYSTWGTNPQQPDGDDKEKCGSMFFKNNKGTLNDVGCWHKAIYVCEHEISSLSGEINLSFQDLIQNQK